ncbi:HD-GYP domain-containing protein [Desulfotomaculum nigrificans]|uniref:HD-GYP domain-containing protein n=1 Tax=Desulfotomaculum nigrificans TaxID=1565 RepID=UPI0001FAE62F|nr:HD-GYP domain-containing protein [Desulfotomaculum nigrificans]
MRLASVASLWPGMKVARSIYRDDGKEILRAGEILSKSKIEKLLLVGIQFLWVEDGYLSNTESQDVVAKETRAAAVRQVKSILLETRETGRLVIEPQTLYSTVNQFTDQILAQDNLIFNMIDLRNQDDYTFAHSVNVCILALMTGITMGLSRQELTVLGAGALLHDIGKVKIPDQILNKPDSLAKQEFLIMQQHPVLGYQIIKESKKLGDVPAVIALQHHENYDGSGYPAGLRGDAFHLYAQITSIADRFDAITANRVYRKAFPPHEAYEMCAASGNYYFNQEVVKAFLYNIAAYPKGTVVELNNGMIGVVLDTPKGCSLFPTVRVFLDEKQQPISEHYEISLLDKAGLSIVRVLQYPDE